MSQSIKLSPDERVMRWLTSLSESDTFISVISLLEIRIGIELTDPGRKRTRLESWLTMDVQTGYAGRILPITKEIADECGRLVARRKKDGAIPEGYDALIAATAIVHGLTVATLNRKHFEPLGVELVDL